MASVGGRRRRSQAKSRHIITLLTLPVLILGALFSFLSVLFVSPPIVEHFNEAIETDLSLASELAIEIAEQGLDELLNLRLSRSPAMVATVRNDVLDKIGQLARRMGNVDIAVLDSAGVTQMSTCDCLIPQEPFVTERVKEGPEPRLLDFGEQVLADWRYFPFFRWIIVAHSPIRVTHAPLEMTRGAIAFSTAGATGSLILVVMLVFHWIIVRRLNELAGAAISVAEGAYPAIVPRRNDEIGRLANAFTHMVGALEHKEEVAQEAYERVVQSETRFRRIVETTTAGYFSVESSGEIKETNRAFAKLHGYGDPEEMVGLSLKETVSDESRKALEGYLSELFSGRAVSAGELVRVTRDGEPKTNSFSGTPVLSGSDVVAVEGFIIDTTEQKKSEEQLRRSLREKEALLREVHHRVRNNLNVIVSLLRLQSAGLSEDDSRREFFEIARSRIMAMSLVHSLIYESDRLEAINLEQYVRRLCETVIGMSSVETGVETEFEIESVDIPLEQGVPLGIIVNEALTNALKHAFGRRKKGKIRVTFKNQGATGRLSIEDDGNGMQPEKGEERATMGMTLITELAGQLDGEAQFLTGTHGTAVLLLFPLRR